MMTRITVTLPVDTSEYVRLEAKRRRVPVSQVVREALQGHFGPHKGKRPVPFAALYASGHTDSARRADEILAESWADAIRRDR